MKLLNNEEISQSFSLNNDYSLPFKIEKDKIDEFSPKIEFFLKNNCKECLDICKHTLNKKFSKSTVFSNFFLASELFVKSVLIEKGISWKELFTHNINTFTRYNVKTVNELVEKLNNLLSSYNLDTNDISSMKYNYNREGKVIFKNNDPLNENEKRKVESIIEWIMKQENFKII